MARAAGTCTICGRRIDPPKRGPIAETHPACFPLMDALQRLERQLQRLPDLTPTKLLELRYRLLCASTEVPRPRDERGRFIRAPWMPRDEAKPKDGADQGAPEDRAAGRPVQRPRRG